VNQGDSSIISDAAVMGMNRLVVYNLRNGMPVVRIPDGLGSPVFDKSREEALINLPSYTLGGEYILFEKDDALLDENARLRFRVAKNAAAYAFMPRGTTAPEGWSFVEGNADINQHYYPGGTDVYMKRLNSGSVAEVPGTTPGQLLPLIAIQELGSISAEITLQGMVYRDEDGELRETPILPAAGDNFEGGTIIIAENAIGPWQYSRRLPLRSRWLVNTGDGWLALEDNRFELPDDTGGYIRLRLELYTPDGQVEYRTEKTIGITEKSKDVEGR
jgi:hypothetical protein